MRPADERGAARLYSGGGPWSVAAGIIVVIGCSAAAALALLPAILIGFVLLLRDVLGPTALPFGMVISVLSWLSPDWASRALALQALLTGFDSGLAAHLVRPILIACCALAPAAAIVAPLQRLSPLSGLLWRLAALLTGGVAMRWGGAPVAWCLLPTMCVFALRAGWLTDRQTRRRRAEAERRSRD